MFIHIHCSVFKDQSAFQQRRLFYQIFIFLSSIIFHTWFDFVCCFFDSEWYFIKYHSVCQALFYLFFCACFRCLCQRISVYHPQSRLSMFFFSNIRCWPMPILFFRLLSCSDIYLLYTLSRKCQHLFSPFFDIFSSPLKKRKRQPFFLGIKAAFLYLLLCYFSTASTSSAICSAVRWFSCITSSGLYLSRNSFFKPKFSTFTSESP